MAASRSGSAPRCSAAGPKGTRPERRGGLPAARPALVLLNPAVVSSADVVVIGGGAIGASTAFHLRELGVDVVLVERETLASGSTSKAAGGIRAQFADELNVRIALRSMAELERMDGIAWKRAGYLFLLDDPGDLERFRAALELQRRLGVPSRELTVEEARRARPAAGAGRPARRDLLPARRLRRARGRRPVVRPRPERPPGLRGDRHRGRRQRPDPGGRDEQGPDRHRDRRLLRRRLVARGGRARRRRDPGRGRAAPHVVHARGRGAPGPAAAHGRLRDELLPPPRGAGHRVRREGADARGGRAARRAPPPRAARAAGSDELVGLLRGLARPQRDRRRGDRAEPLPLRDGLLRPRLPAGAGGRRVPGRPRHGPRAGARPEPVRARPLRQRRAPARGLRDARGSRRRRRRAAPSGARARGPSRR